MYWFSFHPCRFLLLISKYTLCSVYLLLLSTMDSAYGLNCLLSLYILEVYFKSAPLGILRKYLQLQSIITYDFLMQKKNRSIINPRELELLHLYILRYKISSVIVSLLYQLDFCSCVMHIFSLSRCAVCTHSRGSTDPDSTARYQGIYAI